MRTSAGLLPYRVAKRLEVLIAHPGGPFYARRDAGVWSLIKGEVGEREDPYQAALREFTEETGWEPPAGGGIDLGSVRQAGGKVVRAWAFAADLDPATLVPGEFEMRWRGRLQRFPEIDRVVWAAPEEAVRLLNPAQGAFVERLRAAMEV
jgi:predicted NUDIX family NTP pyrophosphohydrolase